LGRLFFISTEVQAIESWNGILTKNEDGSLDAQVRKTGHK
jgi:hypothetical protein